MKTIAAAALPGCLLAILSSTAHAGAQTPPLLDYEQVNAPGLCTPVTHADGLHLRARPRALVNEGGYGVFVTCNLPSNATYWSPDHPAGREVHIVEMTVANESAGDLRITCTLIDGYSGHVNFAAPMSFDLPVDGNGRMAWSALDLYPESIMGFIQPNLQCSLPPGGALYEIVFAYKTPPAWGVGD